MRNLWCLSKQGLYFFLGRSDKKAALPYQMWLASEVVPSIRKHGAYAASTTIDKIIEVQEFGQVHVVMQDCEPWFVGKEV